MELIINFSNGITLQSLEFIKAFGPICLGILTVVFAFITQKILLNSQKKQYSEQNNLTLQQIETIKSKEEKDEINLKLNTFYGPFLQLRMQSKILYRKFALDIKKEYKENNKQFRTLQFLIEGNKFNEFDTVILKQILNVGNKILDLIENKSGVVDNFALQDLLGKYATHIRVLSLASEYKLPTPSENYEDIVYPLQIDSAIECSILKLKDRLKIIDNIGNPRINKDKIPSCNMTIDYYNTHAREYAKDTLTINLNELYDSFLEKMPRWARILDAGCGVGRDTRYFINNGNTVISFDASEEMVHICQENPFSYCIQQTFKNIDYNEYFEGVWACASLLHLPLEEAIDAVYHLATTLKPNGIMFISVKEGNGTTCDNGRFFQYYSEDEIKKLYSNDKRLLEIKTWKTESNKIGSDDKIIWINLLLRKIN